MIEDSRNIDANRELRNHPTENNGCAMAGLLLAIIIISILIIL